MVVTEPADILLSTVTLARYVKLRVAHAPGMPGTFFPPLRVSDPDIHHDTCVTHVPWCMPGSSTCGFLWSRWWGKRSRHSRRMHYPQFCVSGKMPLVLSHLQAQQWQNKLEYLSTVSKYLNTKIINNSNDIKIRFILIKCILEHILNFSNRSNNKHSKWDKLALKF